MLAWITEEASDATALRLLERRIGPIIAANWPKGTLSGNHRWLVWQTGGQVVIGGVSMPTRGQPNDVWTL